jgi:hypothetical protein
VYRPHGVDGRLRGRIDIRPPSPVRRVIIDVIRYYPLR